MTKTLQTPEFKDEAEEAKWWADNQDLLVKEFKQAAKDGTLRRGRAPRGGITPNTTIRLDPADVEMAKAQAQERGLKYQTYLKMVIHQALMRESQAAATH